MSGISDPMPARVWAGAGAGRTIRLTLLVLAIELSRRGSRDCLQPPSAFALDDRSPPTTLVHPRRTVLGSAPIDQRDKAFSARVGVFNDWLGREMQLTCDRCASVRGRLPRCSTARSATTVSVRSIDEVVERPDRTARRWLHRRGTRAVSLARHRSGSPAIADLMAVGEADAPNGRLTMVDGFGPFGSSGRHRSNRRCNAGCGHAALACGSTA